MQITKWEPFKDMFSLRRQIDRVFDDTFFDAFDGGSELATGWAPSVDIHETADELVVKADLPGVEQKDVQVEMHGNMLTVKGEKKEENEVKDAGFLRRERRYGSFQRSFTVGIPVKQDEIKAKYKNGTLEIHLPKAEKVKARQIHVKSE